jgi:hypothetical protein
MKKINYLLVFVLLCSLWVTQDLFSQSLSRPDGTVFATQKGADGFEITGSTFQLKNNRLLEFKDEQLREDLQQGYYTKEGSKIRYYNNEEICVGYYVPAEKRFFSVSSGGGKEALAAYTKDGNVYSAEDKLVCKYDTNFDPVYIGFILFFFLGYSG